MRYCFEKVELKDKYTISESPRQMFVKYLVDLAVLQRIIKHIQKALRQFQFQFGTE